MFFIRFHGNFGIFYGAISWLTHHSPNTHWMRILISHFVRDFIFESIFACFFFICFTFVFMTRLCLYFVYTIYLFYIMILIIIVEDIWNTAQKSNKHKLMQRKKERKNCCTTAIEKYVCKRSHTTSYCWRNKKIALYFCTLNSLKQATTDTHTYPMANRNKQTNGLCEEHNERHRFINCIY